MAGSQADAFLGLLMRQLRVASGATLTDAADALAVTKGHLSNVERGRDPASRAIVAYYEETYHGDGHVWAAWTDVKAGTRTGPRSAPAPHYPLPGDESTFVADVTVPDGLPMPPGFEFDKIWRIRNTGTVPWIGRWLLRTGAPAAHGLMRSERRVRIADTMPGQEVEIAVHVRAQPQPGTSYGRWKMADDEDNEYFPTMYPEGLLTTILVVEGAPAPRITRLA